MVQFFISSHEKTQWILRNKTFCIISYILNGNKYKFRGDNSEYSEISLVKKRLEGKNLLSAVLISNYALWQIHIQEIKLYNIY